ncbi:MAG: type I DNA topoisomerase, partial [Myxococcota bacterium]
MSKPLVIVESPTKRDTIRKFLGPDYMVEASVGHVRDLPESASDIPKEARERGYKDLGVNVEGDFQPYYVVLDRKKEQVAKLKAMVKDASMVYLATDEDREGESISWHLQEVLKPRVPVKRLVFHEITREAIRHALEHPRDIDTNLVHAQEARRIVDRLYGWPVSKLLWHKIRPGLSAGRVQSVAVRLVVDRERARMAFKSATWWDLEALFGAAKGSLPAHLVEVGGKRIATGKDFDELTGKLTSDARLLDEAGAHALAARLKDQPASVLKVDSKPWKESPRPPFTTSTLQQEANRKLRWSASRTMKTAQRLYEHGWITYMRTDSISLSEQALQAARTLIAEKYGKENLPNGPRTYTNKVKNAQEAHEAIRPAGARFRTLDEAHRDLGGDEAKLYELIWKRTVASQMADARGLSSTVTIGVQDARFTASGRVIEFPGFRLAYVEGSDDPEAELAEQERPLPAVTAGEKLRTDRITPRGHTTQPPARLTEATLVKELEARGIGRPSTYASIIETIIAREYVFKRGNALVPTFTAFAVTGLMERHLAELVDYDFTARMEDDLDRVAVGNKNWVDTVRAFYRGDKGLESRLAHAEKSADPRSICTVPVGTSDGMDVVVRIGRNGPFLSGGEGISANLPDEVAPDEVTAEWAAQRLKEKAAGPRELGRDGDRPVYLLTGRFGPFVQLGEATEGEKPPRASLLPGMSPDTLDLETAVLLLSLPRKLGKDPDTGEPIEAANGRYGPYVRRGKESRSVPPTLSILTITLDQARELFKQERRARAAITPIAELGADPASGGTVKVMKGRFGPYVTDGTTNATLPKGTDPSAVALADAIDLLAKRRA